MAESDAIADEAEYLAHGHRFVTLILGDLDDPVIAADLAEFFDLIGCGRSTVVELHDQSRRHVTLRVSGLDAALVQGDLIELARHVNARWQVQDTMRPVVPAR